MKFYNEVTLGLWEHRNEHYCSFRESNQDLESLPDWLVIILLLEKAWKGHLLHSVQDLEEFPAAQDFDIIQYIGNNRGF